MPGPPPAADPASDPASDPWPPRPRFAASRFAALLAAAYAAVGVTLPFLPPFLAGKGMAPGEVALILFAGSATRFAAGPVLGRLADGLGDGARLLAPCALAGAAAALLFVPAGGFATLLLAQLLFNLALAPVSPLAEGLTVAAARDGLIRDYGRVRAWGSVAFILAALGAGWLAARLGHGAMPWLLGLAYLGTALAAWSLPRVRRERPPATLAAPRLSALSIPGFRRVVALSALIQGSHAAYYGFGSIHWEAAGIAPGTIGVLWSLGVVAEIAVFLVAGPMVARLGLSGMMALAAGAGVLRWGLTAATVEIWALVPLQLLHGLTFGAQHLAAMRWIGAAVPPGRAMAAQGLHASLGVVAAQAVAMLAAGWLYAWTGAGAFLAMAALCLLALPVSRGVVEPRPPAA